MWTTRKQPFVIDGFWPIAASVDMRLPLTCGPTPLPRFYRFGIRPQTPPPRSSLVCSEYRRPSLA
jgi:hypothetical protein